MALLDGRSGGQSIYGGTASGEDLYLRPTTHTVKGTIFLDQGDLNSTIESLFDAGFKLPLDTDSSGASITALASTGKSAIRLTYAGAATLKGIANGADGKLLLIHNVTANDLIVSHNNASAAAGDKIYTPGGIDVTATSNSLLLLQYDSTSSVWRLVSGGGGSGGGAFTTQNFTGTSFTATDKGFQRWRYTGSSAQALTAITLSSLTDAAVIHIQGTSDTNTLTIPASATGLYKLNGSIELGAGNVLSLQYDSTLGGLVEISRS